MKLNDNQFKAVNHEKGHALIIAGPGSGKTTVVSHRYNKNFSQNKNTLCLTFSNKATQEMKKRINSQDHKGNIYSFHGFAYKILKQYNLINQKIISESEQKRISQQLGVDPEKINKFHQGIEKKPMGYDRYIRYCHDNEVIDFGQVIYSFIDLVTLHKIKFNYQEIIIDEFQDINNNQYKMIQLMISNSMTTSTVFAVGDDDQGIYQWRGANSDFMINFDKYFGNHQKYFLSINYRSNQNIVELSKYIIKYNQQRIAKNIQANSNLTGNIDIFNNPTDLEIIEYIQSLSGSTGILTRKGSTAQQMEQLLYKYGIPFNPENIFQNKYIQLIIRYLKFLSDPSIDLLKEIINIDSIGIGPKSLEKILNEVDIMTGLQKTKKKVYEFFQQIINLDPINQLEEIINFSPFFQSVDSKTLALIRSSVQNKYEDFINQNQSAFPAQGVQIMTIHKSKGLEFDNVIILNLAEGAFPSFKSSNPEEERRIFYVAITRSKANILMISKPYNNFFGLSKYIANLPAHFLYNKQKKLSMQV